MRRTAVVTPALCLTTALGWAAAATLAGGCGPGDDGTTGACSGILPGDLVITEVFADADAPAGSSGADEGKEWFEIYNASGAPIDLAGVVITHSRPDGSSAKSHTLAAVTIAASDYLVLGNTLPALVPPKVDLGYGSDLGDLFNMDGGKLTITCGATEVDHAGYDLITPGKSRSLDGGPGASVQPDYQANDSQGNWCNSDEDAAREFSPSNFGSPGTANQDCMNVTPGMCEEAGNPRPTVPPVPGDLTITEVLPSPSAVSDTTGEWFEVLVNRDVDLNDLGLDRAGDMANPVILTSPACKRATAGSYLVFARSMDAAANGMLPRVDGLFNFSLVGGSAATPGDVRLMMGATELDKLTWTSSRNGRALQLSAGLTAPADNDVAANLCDGAATYGAGDFGTPGTANARCTGNMAGMCLDTGTNMMRPIVKPTAGQLTINEWMPDPSLVADTAGEWFELKATGAFDLNGLQAGTTALGATPIVPAGGACVPIPTGGLILFAHGNVAATNGMLPMVDGLFGFALTNSNGMLQVGVDGAVLDMKSWATSVAGKSIMLDTDGTQCNAPAAVVKYNGTDFGTPRLINTPPECP